MEITFTHVFPKARSNFTSFFWTVFIFTLIQSIGCGEIRPDWDLAVAHGRQVTLFSTSTRSEQVFGIPVPTALTIHGPTSATFNNTGVHIASNSNDNQAARNNSQVPHWEVHHLKTIALDLSRELIFFTSGTSSQNLSIIAVFNVTSNESYALYQSDAAEIDGMVFYNGSLFWTDVASNSIMRLNTENEITSWSYDIFYQPKHLPMRGLAVDAKSNTFFWTTDHSIQYYDGQIEGDAVTNVSAHGLTTDSSHLYWIESPSVVHFTIKRVLLSRFTQQEEVYVGRHQNVYALNVLCSDIIAWLDSLGSQAVLKNITRKNKKFEGKPLKFKSQPYGMISKSLVMQDWDNCVKIPSSSEEEFKTASFKPTTPKMTDTTTQSKETSKIISKMTEATTKPTTTTTTKSISDIPIIEPIGKAAGEPVNILNNPNTSENSNIVTMSSVVQEIPSYSISNSSSVNAQNTTDSVPRTNDTSLTSSLPNIQVVKIAAANNAPIKWCPKEQMNQCLNGGSCVVVDNNLFCLCLPGFMGRECEKQWSPEDHSSLGSVPQPLMGVSNIVRRLDKKPKIRRRVIVRSGQRQRGSSVCELIDIENCCNMNECETPCFERGTPSTSTSTSTPSETIPNAPKQPSNKKEKSVKEDKERLIDF
ncbi:unnamed protein product [Allacma fusca]|uniref:EGF-like domain-containing protein n=1 Tax=Allacma fusca TaxID=39272 RepID=A0A8J2KJE4_9HEXA|nr:unnamed protein product [Allacma fusca]